MNKVETECAWLCFVGLFELRGYVVCGLWLGVCVYIYTHTYLYVVWICFSRIVQSHAFSFSSKTN